MGTNDNIKGVSDEIFTATYVKFVQDIRAKRGNDVPIVMLIPLQGFKKDAIVAAYNQLNDENLYLVDATNYLTDASDFAGSGNVHPSVAGHQEFGEKLAEELRPILFTAPDLPTSSKDLTVSYAGVSAAGTVYCLDMIWENSDFTFNYVGGTQGSWNPGNHTFGEITGADWEDDDLVVTVVNHSNAAVEISMEITDGDEKDNLIVTSDRATETLVTAEGTTYENAPKVDFTLTIDGTPTESVTKVATATLIFAAAE